MHHLRHKEQQNSGDSIVSMNVVLVIKIMVILAELKNMRKWGWEKEKLSVACNV